MARTIRKVSLFILVISLFSCSEDAFYHEYMTLPEKGWHADSIAQFELDILDTNAQYGLFLKMRHNNTYPYSNIWFFRKITSQNGLEYSDTINYIVADELGKWKGQGIGELKHVVMPFKREALYFKKGGKYFVEIQHGMKDTVLQGVTEIGLEVFSQTTMD